VTRLVLLAVVVLGTAPLAQDVPLEYRVKAAYLFNFTKFVEWPAAALRADEPLTICIAGMNPFGDTLDETLRGESVGGRPLTARAVTDGDGCHVLFVPEGVPAATLLLNMRAKPVLTVGESPEFLRQGGVVNFVMQDGKVRFEISQDAATKAHLRISSHLLRLSRPSETRQ
jgi:hypothetical protein